MSRDTGDYLDYLTIAVTILGVAVVIFVLYGCSSAPVFERQALSEMELRPRPGHSGLTNQNCLEYEGNSCAKFDVMEFDLGDVPTRTKLRDAKFICKVGQRRYTICRDVAGLCSTEEKVDRVLGISVKRELFVTDTIKFPEDIQRAIDGKAVCAALGSPSERLFWGDSANGSIVQD